MPSEICRYNMAIKCEGQPECECCGWNPEVAEDRLARIQAGLKYNRNKMTIILLHSKLPDAEVVSKLKEIWKGVYYA